MQVCSAERQRGIYKFVISPTPWVSGKMQLLSLGLVLYFACNPQKGLSLLTVRQDVKLHPWHVVLVAFAIYTAIDH